MKNAHLFYRYNMMQKAASIFLVFIFLDTSSFSWYQGRTDLPDGDAESSCATLTGSDIGQDLSDEFKSDYYKIPKGEWFRIRGQLRRMSYDASESILRYDDLQRQGISYFQVDSGVEAEYIQNIPFPRASASRVPYNYYFCALMADFDGRGWCDDKN